MIKLLINCVFHLRLKFSINSFNCCSYSFCISSALTFSSFLPFLFFFFFFLFSVFAAPPPLTTSVSVVAVPVDGV